MWSAWIHCSQQEGCVIGGLFDDHRCRNNLHSELALTLDRVGGCGHERQPASQADRKKGWAIDMNDTVARLNETLRLCGQDFATLQWEAEDREDEYPVEEETEEVA
jgi:hypothetical protein